MVWRHGLPDCTVLVKPCLRLHEVEYPLLLVVRYAYLHYTEEVGLREVVHDTGNISIHVDASEDMTHRQFRIGRLGVGIAECSI